MKTPSLFIKKKKKLKATTRAVPSPAIEESEEPSMRLSSAFVVVLLLHLVAIGGMYSFSSIKTHQADSMTSTPPVVPQAVQTKTEPAPVATNTTENTTINPAKPVEHKQPDTAAKPIESGQVYTVAKGDNPVAIAKRFHVNYDELLKLNKIDDPKKLQIGQKLQIPTKQK